MISRRIDGIASLRRICFAGGALGVAFLKFRHVEVMARDFEVALAHVKTRRGFGKVQIFGGAIPIPARSHPKSEFAYRLAFRHFAPTRCSMVKY